MLQKFEGHLFGLSTWRCTEAKTSNENVDDEKPIHGISKIHYVIQSDPCVCVFSPCSNSALVTPEPGVK